MIISCAATKHKSETEIETENIKTVDCLCAEKASKDRNNLSAANTNFDQEMQIKTRQRELVLRFFFSFPLTTLYN